MINIIFSANFDNFDNIDDADEETDTDNTQEKIRATESFSGALCFYFQRKE